jgi:hypothetical protein
MFLSRDAPVWLFAEFRPEDAAETADTALKPLTSAVKRDSI